jgi:hypothetical protein
MQSDDLLVVGLDLVSARSVSVGDGSYEHWRTKGVKGDHSLVCLYCHRDDGRHVPLVIRGREGGYRRRHFAHPPGLKPHGGHGPETVWHVDGKLLLQRWARRQPDVASAQIEWATNDRSRRADVQVVLLDGTVLAIELQSRRLTDGEWLERHRDYAAQDIVDVWLWRGGLDRPGIQLTHDSAVWFLNVGDRLIGTPLGRPHPKPKDWYVGPNPEFFGVHYPPCLNDDVTIRWTALSDMAVGRAGLHLPAKVDQELRADRDRLRRGAADRTAAAQTRSASRLVPAAPDPKSPARPAPTPHRRPRPGLLPPAPGPQALGRRSGRSYWVCSGCGTRTGLNVCTICHPSRSQR